MSAQINSPWEQGPKELIELAIEHVSQQSDAHWRVGFLLLDVGVETLFRVYLRHPPDPRAGSLPVDSSRAERNFPELLNTIFRTASDHLDEHDRKLVGHYHSVRNKLYHEADDGTTVTQEYARSYATLAVKLLKQLLQVDLTANLEKAKPVKGPRSDSVHKDGPNKYQGLGQELEKARKQGQTRVVMTFQQIEELIADKLPPSARSGPDWWSNAKGHVQAKSWIDAGWSKDGVDTKTETVTFRCG
jgi:hypothetical protein